MSLEDWNRAALDYATGLREGKDKGRVRYEPFVSELLGEVSGKRVLDAGCGEGYWMRKLAAWGAEVTGIDGSPDMVRLASDIPTPGTRLHVSDLTRTLPFPSVSFDVVLCNMVLMDLPVIGTAIQEFARVLVPEGCLVFSITHPCFFTFDWVMDDSGNRLHKAVSNYTCETAITLDFWGKTMHYHRPLGAYFEALERAGLAVDALREIQMHDTDGVPSFLVARARKQPRQIA